MTTHVHHAHHSHHLPYSYYLVGMFFGVAVLPPLIIWGVFRIAKALLGP